MRNAIIVTMAAVLATGCATVNKQPIDSNVSEALKSQSVVPTSRSKPDFTAMTAGKAAFAVVGAFAMISAGNEIIAKNNVPDPSEAIARGLGKSLTERYGSQFTPQPITVSTEDAAQLASAANGQARYVLDVQTILWNFAYFPTDWTHYRVMYSAKARLIDTEKKTVVAEGVCKQIPEDNNGAPTHDELLANEATLLKQKLSDAATECVKILNTEMLAI